MNPLRSTRSIVVAIVAMSITACVIKAFGRVSGLKNEPLDLGRPHYYDVSLDSCVRAVQSAMKTVGLTVEEVRHVSDSVWMLTGKDEGYSGYLEYVRVVVTDSGQRGTIVRAMTRTRRCPDSPLSCEASDTASGPSALQIVAILDRDLPQKTSPVIRAGPSLARVPRARSG